MRFWIFQLLNGLTTGALLFFVASGLTVVFGLMRILNLSHGALFLLGGYVGLSVQHFTGNFFLAALAGAATSGLMGLLLQQTFTRTLLGSTFNQVLLTLGIAFILNNGMLAIWGGLPQKLKTPDFLSESISVFGVTYPSYRLFLIVLAFAAGLALWVFWERSTLGAVVRSCVDDREMAAAMGIRVDLVFASVFAIGASMAGLTGVLGGPVLGVYIGLDFEVLLLAVVVVVIGGIGSLNGAFVGSMMVGLIDTFGKASFPEISYFTLFAPVILILLLRPLGLFGRILPE
ncbi:MAG: branched-chain amino acid ABC transporter permease [Chloroflexi bacterium]|nr:MAG: branched-chain amino acid ABC transporter permease [Chloroflexota bacterium]MBL1195062.1 branched-chain amino acid ABC transporter permease [Chloroflexota bacterium]NOH12350.1 branched-chain amino acid ABC transporter permease [Chloroflexota bacterium]